MTEIRVPVIVSISRWFKRAGDSVGLDGSLVEIETDTDTHEIRAPVTGVLSSIAVRDGASVEVGTVLGTISQFF
jgi:2-oxoglutarate dehydrogenase E2 component (dihydrolipoamide succinyltransferase)